MTQHMSFMEFSDEEEEQEDRTAPTIGYLQLLPPFNRLLHWDIKELRDGERWMREQERDTKENEGEVGKPRLDFSFAAQEDRLYRVPIFLFFSSGRLV